MFSVLLQSLPIPFSAYALCLFPLATVILSFIAFATLTDRHANRPYLRYNAFVEATEGPHEAATGETPAGPLAAPAGMTTVFTGTKTGDITPVTQGQQPPADAPANYQPPFEGTNEGVGHSAADDVAPRPGDLDYKRPDLQTVFAPTAQPKSGGAGDAIRTAFAGLFSEPATNPGFDSPTTRTNQRVATAAPPAIAPAAVTPAAKVVAPAPPQPVAVAPAAASMGQASVMIAHVERNLANTDAVGEYVLLRNTSAQPIDMTGWILRDGGNKHHFIFPAFILVAGAEVKLWSKTGANTAADLYWNERGAVWNNTSDTAHLVDAHGNEISRFAYQSGK